MFSHWVIGIRHSSIWWPWNKAHFCFWQWNMTQLNLMALELGTIQCDGVEIRHNTILRHWKKAKFNILVSYMSTVGLGEGGRPPWWVPKSPPPPHKKAQKAKKKTQKALPLNFWARSRMTGIGIRHNPFCDFGIRQTSNLGHWIKARFKVVEYALFHLHQMNCASFQCP